MADKRSNSRNQQNNARNNNYSQNYSRQNANNQTNSGMGPYQYTDEELFSERYYAKKRQHKKKVMVFVKSLVTTLVVGTLVLFLVASILKYRQEAAQGNPGSSKTTALIAKAIDKFGALKGDDGKAETDSIYDGEAIDYDAYNKKKSDEAALAAEAAATEAAEAEEVDTSRYGALLSDEDYCRENKIYEKDCVYPDQVTLLFAGDVGLASGYANLETLKNRGGDISTAFDENTLFTMREADIFMVNNEFTYTRRGEPTPGKEYTFRSDPDNVSYIFDMGADVVSIANNHTYDYGEVSLLDTIDTLNDAGMPFVGAGINIEEAIKPVYFIANDMRIAIVSATQIERQDNPDTKGATDTSAGTFRCWYNDKVCDVVKEAAECSDVVIAYIHWGTELEVAPDWAQLDLAPKLANAGADVIIGDHPHILQKLDYIGDVPIIYSLGNYWFNSKELDTGMLQTTFDTAGNLMSVQFIPAIQKGCRTNIVTDSEKTRILNYMQSISPNVLIDGDGYISKK